MKKLLRFSITAVVMVALALAFAACNNDGGGATDPTTAPPTTAPTTAPPTTAPPTDAPGLVDPPDVTPDLFTSPDGQARVWRDFTASALNLSIMNPHTANIASDMDTIFWTHPLLIRRNQQSLTFEYLPEMAAEMPTISEDGLVWTFHLRQDMQWSTGTPINAHCFDYSYQMRLSPLAVNRNATSWWTSVHVVNARAYFLGENAPDEDLPIVTWDDVGFRVVDDYTIEFTFETRPLDIAALMWFGNTGTTIVYRELYEAGMNEDRTETTYFTSDFINLPNFGPYRVVEIIPDQFQSLQRNDDFINAWQWGREFITTRNIEMASTRDQMFMDGHIDRIVVTADNYYTWREDPRTHRGSGGQPWNVYINTESTEVPALTDRYFRHALYFAVDRELLAWAAFRVFTPAAGVIGTQAIVGDVLSGETMSYRESQFGLDAVPPNYGFDPERAQRYFDIAFANNGNQLIEFYFDYFEGQENMRRNAEILQEMWMSLFGADRINVILRAGIPGAIYDSMRDRTHHMGVGSLTQTAANIWSSMQVYTPYFNDPLTTFNDEEFNEWFRRTTSGDLLHASWEERAYALMRMEQILLDYMPLIPLWQNSNWQVFSERTSLVSPEFQAAGIGFVIETLDPMPWAGGAAAGIE